MRNFLENVEIVNVKLTFHQKSTYSKNLLNEKKKIHHEFWKTVKKNYLVKSGNSGHAKNFNIDGEVTNNPSKVSNGFVSYYTSIITELRKHLFPLNEVVWQKVKSIPTKTIKRFKINYIPSATI